MLRIDATLFIVNLIPDEDVSDDALQKTIHMETRTRAMLKKNISNGFANAGFLGSDEHIRSPNSLDVNGVSDPPRLRTSSRSGITETSFIQEAFSNGNSQEISENGPEIDIKDLDDAKVQKMNAAVRTNQVILEYSKQTQLVLLSLPKPPKSVKTIMENYLAYVEALTEKLPRVILIGGTGKEVITSES